MRNKGHAKISESTVTFLSVVGSLDNSSFLYVHTSCVITALLICDFIFAYSNQRTNGPVIAHLIPGPTVSTKTSNIGKGQPRVITYINFVELESPMLHAKFQDHKTSGYGEEDFKGFHHLWAWWPSWSCDLFHLYKHIPTSKGGST